MVKKEAALAVGASHTSTLEAKVPWGQSRSEARIWPVWLASSSMA